MCDDAISHLGEAQAALSRHLANPQVATEAQFSQLSQQVEELKNQVEEVHQHQLSFHHGAVENTKQWTALADQGKLVDAIKGARVAHGLGLMDAKRLVTAYKTRKYAFAQVPLNEA